MFSSGAMFGTQLSQGFNMGGMNSAPSSDPAATQDATAPKRPKQEVKETCLPVTIRAVEVALEKRGETGEDLKFYGVAEPQMVLVVAVVESMARQAASVEVTLNDATGRIKGRWFLADPKDGELDRIAPGSYVSVFGEVRTAPEQHLALKGMRPVTSADEVSYHMIEAAHAALRLQTGWRSAKDGQKAEVSTPTKKKDQDMAAPASTPEKPQAGVQAGVPEATPVANPYAVAAAAAAPAAPPAKKGPPTGAELRAAVLEMLRDAAVGPEGLHMDVITQKAGAASADVKAIVAELVDDGDVFSTITEEHVAAV